LYTFSKNLDNVTATPYDSYHLDLVRGPADLDRRHLMTLNFIYELPLLKGRKTLGGNLLGGWQISGVAFCRSGVPLSIVDATDTAGVGPGSGSQPWNTIGNTAVAGDRGLGTLWFNRDAFGRPDLGTFGNAGMGILRGPGFQNLDLALFKNFRILERLNAQFRLETFNTVNHPVLDNPNISPRSGSFGLITSKSNERNMQLGLKLLF
jgi:hypothetical protein